MTPDLSKRDMTPAGLLQSRAPSSFHHSEQSTLLFPSFTSVGLGSPKIDKVYQVIQCLEQLPSPPPVTSTQQ